MVKFIRSTFERARVRFGTARENIPLGGQERQRYFFDSFFLTNGLLPPMGRNCNICGKIGHWAKECPFNKSNRKKEGQNKTDNGQHSNINKGEQSIIEKSEQSKGENSQQKKAEIEQKDKSENGRQNIEQKFLENKVKKSQKNKSDHQTISEKIGNKTTFPINDEKALKGEVQKNGLGCVSKGLQSELETDIMNRGSGIRANSIDKGQSGKKEENIKKNSTEGNADFACVLIKWQENLVDNLDHIFVYIKSFVLNSMLYL